MDWVTFDCYGTLIDWYGGMRAFLAGRVPDVDAAVRRWEEAQVRLQSGPFKSYRAVLNESSPVPGDAAEHLKTWTPHPGVREALTELKKHAKLGIISNTDRDLVAASIARIGVDFDGVVTAEDARAYKPSPAIFRHAIKALGLTPSRTLHVSFTFWYDLIPAREFGFKTCWINTDGRAPEVPVDVAVRRHSEILDFFLRAHDR